MKTRKLTVPYKGEAYDVDIAIVQTKAAECRITACVAGQEILFVSNNKNCKHAVYRENIIAEGLMDEIGKRICAECL